jgi:acetate---CoA ligase (ADP-forming)
VATVLREVGVPTYAAIESAVGVLRRLAAGAAADMLHVPAMPAPAVPPPAGPATDAHQTARRLLSEAGITFVAARTVTDSEQAIAAAEQLGYPVVLKALGRLHKSDAGGVVLGLGDQAQLARAFAEVSDRLAPPSFSIERMAPLGDGLELLIGARWDARFGPVAVAGSGGIYAEILDDIAVALAPVSETEARRMLASLRAAPLLAGARGRPALDLDAGARALAALSVVAAGHPELAEIEINPLLVMPHGALALDARLIPATTRA